MKFRLYCLTLFYVIFAGCVSAQSFQRQYYIPDLEPFRTSAANWGLYSPLAIVHPIAGTSTISSTLISGFSPTPLPPPYNSDTYINFLTRIDTKGHVKFSRQAPSIFRFFDPSFRKVYPAGREDLILAQEGSSFYPLDSAIQNPAKRTLLIYLDSNLSTRWSAIYGFISGSLAKTVGFRGIVDNQKQLLVLFNGVTGPLNATNGTRFWLGYLRKENGSLDSAITLRPNDTPQSAFNNSNIDGLHFLDDTTLSFQWVFQTAIDAPYRHWNVLFNSTLSKFRYISLPINTTINVQLQPIGIKNNRLYFSGQNNLVGYMHLDSTVFHYRKIHPPYFGFGFKLMPDKRIGFMVSKADTSDSGRITTCFGTLNDNLEFENATIFDTLVRNSTYLQSTESGNLVVLSQKKDESLNWSRTFTLTSTQTGSWSSFCYNRSVGNVFDSIESTSLDTLFPTSFALKPRRSFDVVHINMPTEQFQNVISFCAKIPCQTGSSPIPASITSILDSCEGTVTLKADPEYLNPVWSNGHQGHLQTVSDSGWYKVSFEDACAIGADSVKILPLSPLPPYIQPTADTTGCGPYSFAFPKEWAPFGRWYVNDTLAATGVDTFTVSPGKEVRAELVHDCGITTVTFFTPKKAGCNPAQWPNLITLNGDNTNDHFFVLGQSIQQLQVWNRWGKMIYQTDSYENNWPPKDCLPGTYFFKAQVKNESRTGWLVVIR